MAIVVYYETQMIMYLVRTYKVATPNHLKQPAQTPLMLHLGAIGQAVYGRCWRRPTARALQVHHRTLLRRQSGQGGPTVHDLLHMLGIAREHYSGTRRAHDAALRALQLDKPAPAKPDAAAATRAPVSPSPIRTPTLFGAKIPSPAPTRRG